MKSFCIYLIIVVSTVFYACSSKEHQAHTAFSTGVKLNLKALDHLDNGKKKEAAALNLKAMEQFKETLRIDPKHEGALIAMANAYFLSKDYKQAMVCYENVVKTCPKIAEMAKKEMERCRVTMIKAEADQIAADNKVLAE